VGIGVFSGKFYGSNCTEAGERTVAPCAQNRHEDGAKRDSEFWAGESDAVSRRSAERGCAQGAEKAGSGFRGRYARRSERDGRGGGDATGHAIRFASVAVSVSER